MATTSSRRLASDTLPRLTPPNVSTARGHVSELDGIRAIAIVLVFIAHLFFTWPADPVAVAQLPHPVHAIFSHGWLGVDLFFVLSGFLITGILLRTKHRGRGAYFRQFYWRRTLRILPLYLAVLAVLALAYGPHYGPYFLLCALLSANLAPLFNIDIPGGAGPYWSLAVEEQFYLLWPWLVLWLDARKLTIVAALVIALEPLVRTLYPGTLEYTWCRADGLAMGAFLAAWFETWNGDAKAARNLVVGLIAIPVVITIIGLPFGVLHQGALSNAVRITQAVLIFGALVAAGVAFASHPALAILRSAPLRITALLSFCLYLVHRPLIDAFTVTFGSTAWYSALAPVPAALFRAVVVVAAAYIVATISRRYLELPFLRLGRAK